MSVLLHDNIPQARPVEDTTCKLCPRGRPDAIDDVEISIHSVYDRILVFTTSHRSMCAVECPARNAPTLYPTLIP